VCTAGGYCPEGSTAPTDCPAGYYCEEGAAVPAPCPAGTYSDLVALVEMDQCVQCPAGKYCEQSGSSEPTGDCSAGYYCPSGSSSSEQKVSPAGHYCPTGAAAPTPCPKNTYGDVTGLQSSDQCAPCPQGKETFEEGSTSIDQCKEVNCSPGYYKDHHKGCQICPKGAYSEEENAVTCTKCPVHQYNSVEGSVQCMKCPDTAFTWTEGTDSFSGCIGPVIEACSGEDMTGTCDRYYDDNLNVTSRILSVQVIKGEFELFNITNHRGYFTKLTETDGPRNVADIESISVLRSFSPLINDVFCSLDQGWKFHGSIRSTSKSGKACINWKRTPLADKAAPNHYCQNPDGTDLADKPFCYISETETEECDIPSCIWNMDCFTGIGAQYRGKQATTDHNKNCNNWNSDFPHPHSYHSPQYNWAGVGDHRFCRNPSEEGKPWCYTTNLLWRWDYCTIARCSRDSFDFYRF